MTRRLLALLLSAFAGSLVLGVAAPAQAADYYRSWTFFNVEDGKYVVSMVGVAGVTPADGSVEAYRYAAPADFNKPNLPRLDLATITFDSVCADTAAVDGQKRVAVLVDFGVTEDSEGATVPGATAECAQLDTKATALQVLQKVAETRTKDMGGPFVCAIDGYPASGCAPTVQTATPADSGFVTVTSDQPAAAEDDSHTALYAGLGAIVVVLLAGGAFVARRDKSA
jgi:hypothetical protein